MDEYLYLESKDKAEKALELRLYKDAVKHLEKCVELNNEDVWAYESLGDSYFELYNHEKAVEYYEKTVRLDNTKGDVLNKLGNIFFQKNNFILAKKYYFLAMKKNEYNPKAIYKLAYICFYKNSIGEAVIYYNQALNSAGIENPNLKNKCHFNLGQIYLLRNEIDKALKHFEEIDQEQWTEPDLFVKLAYCYYQKNETGSARMILEESLEKFPSYFPIYYNLGKLELEANNIEFGIKMWKKYLHEMEKKKQTMQTETYQKIVDFLEEHNLL